MRGWCFGLLVSVLVLVGFSVASILGSARRAAFDPWKRSITAASATAKAAPRASCDSRSPLRQAFFGDLHVHTRFSYDSAGRGVTLRPDDAYRFATGEAVGLPPFDNSGAGRSVRIDRPLDFAMVADHSEWLGETGLCMSSDSSVYDRMACRGLRGEILGPLGILAFLGETRRGARSKALCGEDGARCRDAVAGQWSETKAAAERWYDRSSLCAFTTFHGYEYSRRKNTFMMHRNVMFRNEVTPELPISSIDTERLEDLWLELESKCLDTGGDCDVLAIPHNPNFSSGYAFAKTYAGAPLEEQKVSARRRARLEPVVEIMQAKGESECRNGLAGVVGAPDEFCEFEKLFGRGQGEVPVCEADESRNGDRCLSPLSYARYALAEGLGEANRLGINPLRIGFVGSTDTHNATPGDVDEDGFSGTSGIQSATSSRRLQSSGAFGIPGNVYRNPGGLAGVWSEENSREALFDAVRRRETFATSGPRIRPRVFAGPALPDDLCERGDFAAIGCERGVPMGGTLVTSGGASLPSFAVRALRDPGTAGVTGTRLERIQIIKVWSEGQGSYGQAVYDVAHAEGPPMSVDLGTCETSPGGADELCAVWSDPDFDDQQEAAYYARVLEGPSCRWSHRQCLDIPSDLRPEICDSLTLRKRIQERAWTSPIWVTSEGHAQ